MHQWINKCLLILGIVFMCSMQYVNAVHAEEKDEMTKEDMLFVPEVSLVTDTSVVYNMHGYPAVQIPIDAAIRGNAGNPYKVLKIPAQITRQGDYYFIVDTYHDQVIYTKDLSTPVENWKVMTSDVTLPHAVASDGNVYLVTDTEENRVLVFEWKYGRFQNTQRFDNIGIRPHYIEYDEVTDSFFVWSSTTGDMYIMKKEPLSGIMYIQEVRHINELAGYYVRSFTIDGKSILFPSGTNGYMIIADKNTLKVKQRYAVTQEVAGMAYALKIENYYYMTVSTNLSGEHDTATMIRTSDLNSLANGQYEDVYSIFNENGIPYYIDIVDGKYYMTNHEGKNSILKFSVENDVVVYEGYLIKK